MMGRVQVWLVEAPLRWSRLPRDGRRLVTYVSMLAALSFLELTAGIATGDGALAFAPTVDGFEQLQHLTAIVTQLSQN